MNALILHGGWDEHEPEACPAVIAEGLTRRGLTVQNHATLDCLADDDTWLGA